MSLWSWILTFQRLGKTRTKARCNRGRRQLSYHFSEKISRIVNSQWEEIGKIPRKSPIQCWGCGGDQMYRYFSHEVEKVRIVHNVQQAATIEDMRRNVPPSLFWILLKFLYVHVYIMHQEKYINKGAEECNTPNPNPNCDSLGSSFGSVLCAPK
jgi:hypothetical protein